MLKYSRLSDTGTAKWRLQGEGVCYFSFLAFAPMQLH